MNLENDFKKYKKKQAYYKLVVKALKMFKV